ncbi:hypothetical protein ACQZ44_20165 [Agrobacterium vitis]
MTTPRLLTQGQAAKYCNLSPAQFNAWVKAGRISGALAGTHRWDKVALDRDIDRLSGIKAEPQTESALEKWKKDRDARRAQGAAQNHQAAR